MLGFNNEAINKKLKYVLIEALHIAKEGTKRNDSQIVVLLQNLGDLDQMLLEYKQNAINVEQQFPLSNISQL